MPRSPFLGGAFLYATKSLCHMDYNAILDQVGYPPEYNREKAIEAIKLAMQPQPAPQDLRERADEFIKVHTDLLMNSIGDYCPVVHVDDCRSIILQFASEVSGGKDAEIEELKESETRMLNDMNSAISEYGKAQQRIAELEGTLQRLCFLNNAEMEGIRPPHPGDWFNSFVKAEEVLNK